MADPTDQHSDAHIEANNTPAPADEADQFPPVINARPEEEKKNQPEYLGDKADEAVERMENNGPPLSDEAEQLLEQGIRDIHDAAEGE